MQATKDSFYIALRDRLVQCDPNLTITIDGATRPAIVVLENEPPSSLQRQENAFYLQWGDARLTRAANSTLMAMDCVISYSSAGQRETGGVGRGRSLAALDADLLTICAPPHTEKFDYSSDTPADLNSSIFWVGPQLTTAKLETTEVGRGAQVTVFFYPQVNQP
jgi:hypothetical protein